MKNRIKRLLAVLVCVAALVTGCSEADIVNANISQQADYFECERKITVYNARTGMVTPCMWWRILPGHTQILTIIKCIFTRSSRFRLKQGRKERRLW